MAALFLADIGTMKLYTGLATGSVQIWNNSKSFGDYWVLAQVNVTTKANFELIFDAIIGKFL